jgi:hypothetical protein
MSDRREFSAREAFAIVRRATDAAGVTRCERCGGVAVGGEVHHVDMDAMQIDKSRKLTAAGGLFLCKPCHKEETAKQAPILAKAKRLERANYGVRTAPSRALQSAGFMVSERTAKREPKPGLPPRKLYETIG